VSYTGLPAASAARKRALAMLSMRQRCTALPLRNIS